MMHHSELNSYVLYIYAPEKATSLPYMWFALLQLVIVYSINAGAAEYY